MKSQLNLLLIAFSLVFFNCKQEDAKPKLDYKYANEEYLIICNDYDVLLYNEALYAFEKDIIGAYGGKKKNIYYAYNNYMKDFVGNRIKYDEMVSPYALEVLEALKTEKNLWTQKDGVSKLNYEADIFKCVSSYFKNKDLQTTFNALVSTNSMTPKLFASAILPQINSLSRDRYLTTYIALDYYSNLFGIDAEKVKIRIETEQTEKPVDSINKSNTIINPELNKEDVSDPHAGHNH